MKSVNVNTWDIIKLLCIVNVVLQIILVLFSGVDIRSYANGISLGVTGTTIVLGCALGIWGGSNDD